MKAFYGPTLLGATIYYTNWACVKPAYRNAARDLCIASSNIYLVVL